jgi:hypothetical protein
VIVAEVLFPIGILLIPFIVLSFFIVLPFGMYNICKSYQQATRYPENLNLDLHTGVFFPHYESLKREFFISDSISLLVENLRKYNQPYKIYHCYTLDDFISAYQDPRVNKIWIIGHGARKGVNIGDSFLEYSNLPHTLPKEFIAQLHCNHGGGSSLLEINKPIRGFCSNFSRMTFQNHCYIINYFKNNTLLSVK